jgi:hypothetical protein
VLFIFIQYFLVEDLVKITVGEVQDILIGNILEVKPLSVPIGNNLGFVGDQKIMAFLCFVKLE